MKQSTDTSGRNLIPESNYVATIQIGRAHV